MAANFRAWLKIWNGSLINASGACNNDAQPLDIKQNPHKKKIRNNFLEGFNGLFLGAGLVYQLSRNHSTFKNKFDSKAPVSKVVRTPQDSKDIKLFKSGETTFASISSRFLRSTR